MKRQSMPDQLSSLRATAPRTSSILLLSGTELWERFTYYGMRALLVLYLVAPVEAGGFGVPDRDAAAIYGLFAACVYLSALPGGWIADRYTGPVLAVWLGGLLIIIGNVLLAIANRLGGFAMGLAVIAAGVGLLKPNVTALVARAASSEGVPGASAFSIFYIGINAGGMLGPLLAAALAATFGWRGGFLAAALGMAVGLVAFARVSRRLMVPVPCLLKPSRQSLAMALLAAATVITAAWVIPPTALIIGVLALVAIAAACGFYLLLRDSANDAERHNVKLLLCLFIGASLFWAAGEQAGASLTLFAERFTDRTLLGREFPAAWYQSLYPLFVVLLAPLFALLWHRLARRGRDPSDMTKFGAGLMLGGLGLAIAALASTDTPASPCWLAATYLTIAAGELLISPIGLSAATQLAPQRRISFTAGLWYLSLSLGGLGAGVTAGLFEMGSAAGLGAAFTSVAAAQAVGGVLFVSAALWGRRARLPHRPA